ncbi:HAND domain of the nucleosome remodeling ATPase ISWI protein [Dioscorea alata]|uniref:HAND domain of the nucleosome remodeling ATPase ISWI protein n=1 Tax=Dioscorea alata TaxID=55571 RepID=A0ACB7TVX6_DIOAL|nr:HAND domain of the nucleosome remodeling ATPase ISWI protein [Dioscorea alata]
MRLFSCLVSVQYPTFKHALNKSLVSILDCAMGCIHFQQALVQTKFHIPSLKGASRSYVSVQAFSREHVLGKLQLMIEGDSNKISYLDSSSESHPKCIENDNVSVANNGYYDQKDLVEDQMGAAGLSPNVAKDLENISDKEIQRRQKIGLANKGRTPWNKGRKHSEETRQRIKMKTIEALRNPKIRKKMSEHSRSHSEQSKARISMGLKMIWAKRLQFRRSQEKCYSSWAGRIAEAAKEGGYDQEKLDWDSYDKMKADIEYQFFLQRADKARDKEIAKLRAERAARIRAEKLAMQKEEKAKSIQAKASEHNKPVTKKKKAVMSKALKLKATLTKFHHRKKQLDSLTSVQIKKTNKPRPLCEKWDMELIKKEKMRGSVSLADQIQAVKSRKPNF